MSKCNIYSQNFESDVNRSTMFVDISKLRRILSGYNPVLSGIWQPIVITPSNTNIDHVDPLVEAGLGQLDAFSPCNCQDSQIESLNAGFYQDSAASSLDCEYCGSHTAEWNLYDSDGNSSADFSVGAGGFSANCCNGACDVRMQNDDFITKVPLLHHGYISGFYDFKHLKQFPACSNPGLGFEEMIKCDMNNIDTNAKFVIDWKIKETISEIEYNGITSQHFNEDMHQQSYQKSDLISKTCGNFILTSIDPKYSGYIDAYSVFDNLGTSKDIPSTGAFTKPYGFANNTYNNIFIGGEKIGSYWKWTHTSGIMGWYRYFDINRTNDTRPIRRVDLYISRGDVFWAKNDGPEISPEEFDPAASDTEIKHCPSGLKIVNNGTLQAIVPNQSEFVYISENIYTTFYTLYEKYIELGLEHDEAFRLSTIMCTSPQYDGYTVDLLDSAGPELYSLNDYYQIDILNKHLLRGTRYASYNGLGYVESNDDLFNNLYYKYGGYIWIPPNSSETITFNINRTAGSAYVASDFDMVIPENKTTWSNAAARPATSCGATPNYRRNYTYTPSITAGSMTVSSALASQYRYDKTCGSEDSSYMQYGYLLLNNSSFAELPVSSGGIFFNNIYPRISDTSSPARYCYECGASSSFYLVNNAEGALCEAANDANTFCYGLLANFLNNSEGPDQPDGTRPLRNIGDNALWEYRGYKAMAFNPHIDSVAFHKMGGIFVNAPSMGKGKYTIFDSNISNNSFSSIEISFATQDAGIKLYSLSVEELQSSSTSSRCRRFPIDQGICECKGLNIPSERASVCNTSTNQYSSSSLYSPSLSTRNSIPLSRFGGYANEAEVKALYGVDIPASLAGEFGTTLDDITSYVDPENPYACKQEYTVSLTNYNYSQYDISLINFSTYHSDIYLTISETIDWNGPPEFEYWASEFDTVPSYRINADWKRFLNKVTINNTDLYDQQRKIIFGAGATLPPNVSIEIENPFLTALLNNLKESLGIKGDACSAYSNATGIFSGRGDEISSVNLTFSQVPRKHNLNFKIHKTEDNNVGLSAFNKASHFDPSEGLKNTPEEGQYKSILDDGSVDYLSVLKNQQYKPSNMLYSTLNSSIKNVLNKIGSFKKQKELRLNILRGTNLYYTNFDNKGGYLLNDKLYPGRARYFDYVYSPKNLSNAEFLVPLITKQPLKLNTKSQPGLFAVKVIDEKTLKFPGSLLYFYLGQTNNITNKTVRTIEEYVSNPDSSIRPMTLIHLGDGQGEVFLYIGSNRNNLKNYFYVGDNKDILNIRSNLDINYDNIAIDGYIYGSSVGCYERIETYNSNTAAGGVNINPLSNIVTNKKLVVEFYDENGQPTDGDYTGAKQIKVFTVIELYYKIKKDQDLISIVDRHAFIEYDEIFSTDNDYLLRNERYISKWGDVLEYDGSIINNSHVLNFKADTVPNSIYDNLFLKHIVNDNKDEYYTLIYNTGDTANITLDINENISEPYFAILQKYNLNNDDIWEQNVENYQNYIPVMQVSFKKSSPTSVVPATGYTLAGSMFSNASPIDTAIDPTSNNRIVIDDVNSLIAAFDPPDNWYSNTLRIDNPLFWLKSTSYSKPSASNSSSFREIFYPVPDKRTYTSSNKISLDGSRSTIDRNNSFWRTAVWGDKDDPPDCGPSVAFATQPGITWTCVMSRVGDATMGSSWEIMTPRSLNYASIPRDTKGYIGYNAGLWNPIGSNRYIEIVRSELSSDESLSEISCNDVQPIPTYNNEMTDIYQYSMLAGENVAQSTNVQALDQHANEMLFRILYGEKQVVNREQIFSDKKPLTAEDLVTFSDPKITAASIYDEIIYDYDTAASAVSVQGTITIDAVPQVGESFSMTINGKNITLSIVQVGDDIHAIGQAGGEQFDKKIFEKDYIVNTLITQKWLGSQPQPAAPNPPDDSVTIEALSSKIFNSKPRIVSSGRYDSENLQQTAYGGVGEDWMKIKDEPPDYEPPCAQETKSSDPFTFGYCSIDPAQTNCNSCELCTEIESPAYLESVNFEYSFEQCSTPYTLIGHAYRWKCAAGEGTTTQNPPFDLGISNNPPPDREPPWPGDYCHPVAFIGKGCWVEMCAGYDPRPGAIQGCDGCCAYSLRDNDTINYSIFKQIKTYIGDEYDPPDCPSSFLVINYNNSRLSVSLMTSKSSYNTFTGKVVQSQEMKNILCDNSFSFSSCPDINIGSIPTSWSVSENISSSCGEACAGDNAVGIDTSTTSIYNTVDQVAVCVLGTISWGNVQGGEKYVSYMARRPHDGYDDFGRAMPPCYNTAGVGFLLCDGTFPWRQCNNAEVLLEGKNHQNYWQTNRASYWSAIKCSDDTPLSFSGATANLRAQIWKQGIRDRYNNVYAEIAGSNFAGFDSGGTRGCGVRPEIPNSDIFEGMIPGSCELKFYDSSIITPKFKIDPDFGVVQGDFEINFSVAYIQYTYRTALSPDDHLTGNQGGGTVVEEPPTQDNNYTPKVYTTNNVGNCPSNPFPSRFLATNFFGDPISVKDTYLLTSPILASASCSNTSECYNKHDDEQTICTESDWVCWGQQNRTTAHKFLSRLTGQNWG